MLRDDIMARYILSSHHFRSVRQVTIRLELARSSRAPTFHLAWPVTLLWRPGRGAAMAVQVTPHPSWVAELDSTLEPSRQAILDTPVIIDASENQLVDGQIQNFLVAFYPIIRDFPQWLQVLLDRSPSMGKSFFTDNIRVERRHDAMWRAMGEGFNVHKKRFQEPEPMLPEVKKFHAYLTEMCRNAEFGQAVSATNYAVEGVAQKISEKALRGLAKNEKIGPRGRWWLEEHAKYDDEHPIHALEIIKDCVKRSNGDTDTPEKVTQVALESLSLMKVSMEASYHA